MTEWEDLSSNEKTALRKLAKGEVHDVPAPLIRRLAALGVDDGSPEGRLTSAGLEIYRTRPAARSSLPPGHDTRWRPRPHTRRGSLGPLEPTQLLPAFDQAVHGLPARGHFSLRVGPAWLSGEGRVGDAPHPGLRVSRQLCQEPHPADDAPLEQGDAVGAGGALREGAPPGDAQFHRLLLWTSVSRITFLSRQREPRLKRRVPARCRSARSDTL